MSATDAAPSHRRGNAVTERILKAALTLIAERRSSVVSIEEIADAAGVNKTTVYRRWANTTDLITDAVVQHADDAVPLDPTGDPRADLIALCQRVADNLVSPVGQALSLLGQDTTNLQLAQIKERFWNDRLTAAAELLPENCSGAPDSAVIEWLVGPIHFRITAMGQRLDSEEIEALVDSVLARLAEQDHKR